MTAAQTFRLAVWREWRARWGIYVVAAACAAGRVVLPEREAEGWELFALMMVLPALLAFAAAGGSAAPDAFWRGLGGPAWARALGAPVVHLVGFGLPIAALATPEGVTEERSFLGYLAVLLALYGTIRAARSLTSGVPVLVGPLLGAMVVTLSALVGAQLALWDPWEALGWRLAGLGVLGLAVAPWLDTRFGPWGAGVRRGAARTVTGMLVLAFAGGAAAEVGSGVFADSGARVEDLDGERVLRGHWRGRYWMANRWLTVEQSGRETDLGWGTDGSLGPGGAWVVSHGRTQLEGDTWRYVGGELELHGATGDVTCPIDTEDGCWRWAWRPDGDAVAAVCGVDTWILDVRAGCEKLAGTRMTWLGDTRVTARGGVVSIGDREVGRVEDELFLLGGKGAVLAFTPLLRPGERKLWRVDQEGVHPLFEGRSGGVYLAQGAPCAASDGRHVCWRPDGSTVESTARFLDLDHVYDRESGVVTGLSDGRTWTVPNGWKAWHMAPDTVLVGRGSEVVRLTPDAR